ncbi:MAG: hypothetical protein AMXMBFR83_09950 [Phycisphaerae bacterium]
MRPRRASIPPHLALVTGHPGPVGGMEKFARFLVDAALTADWDVTVALSGTDIFEDARRDFGGGLSVRPVDWIDATFKGDRRLGWSLVRQRRAWFRRVRPDVALFVQSSNTPFRAAVAGAALAGVPVVMTHRTMPYVIPETASRRHLFGLLPGLGLHRRRLVARTRLVAALASTIVYNSEQVRREYERDYGYPHRKGVVIPNAVDAPLLEGPARRAGQALVIGYVGRISGEKRLDVLFRAFAGLRTVRPVRLGLWGEGPERGALAALAAELGIADRVDWHGLVEDVWPAYEACDVVALCSPRESSSNMVLEALAAGRAAVVTNAGGQPELVGHGQYGVIVPPLDVNALTKALESLINNDVKRLGLGVRARLAVAERHDSRAIGRAWLEVLSAAARVGRRKSRRGAPTGDWSKELVSVDLPRL